MSDDKNIVENDTPSTTSSTEQTEVNDQKERTVPLSALQEERRKRQELEAKVSQFEDKFDEFASSQSSGNDDDVELDAVAERLAPVLQKRGFITREERESEIQAENYARQLEELSKKYDGSDGRPVFDATAVAEYSKKSKNFNLEDAYEALNRKELRDWYAKNPESSDAVETEKPASTKNSRTEPLKYTKDYIAERLQQPDGKDWYEKNREKILKYMQE